MNRLVEISENLMKLVNAAKRMNAEIYIVGGYVRNSLLNYTKTDDIDLAGTLDVADICALSDKLGYKSELVNEKLGTVLILADNEIYEYTRFRSENYTVGGKHSPENVEFVTDIKIDAQRRDFTVNSLYYDIINNEIMDFFDGVKDLKNKTLKCISSADKVFESDGLRILRFIRFLCELNFKADKNSYNTALKNAYKLTDISKERILSEIKKIVSCDNLYGFKNQAMAIRLFNSFDIYKYIYNSSLKNLKIKQHSKVFNAYINSNNKDRYYMFNILVLFSYFKKFTGTKNINFTVNSLLGVSGLKDSKINILKITNLYNFTQYLIFKKPITNVLCVKYNEFSESIKILFDIINNKMANKIKNNVNKMKENFIPFTLGDLKITNSDLIENGINAKLISKIKTILFNECLNENIKNNNSDLIDYAKILASKF